MSKKALAKGSKIPPFIYVICHPHFSVPMSESKLDYRAQIKGGEGGGLVTETPAPVGTQERSNEKSNQQMHKTNTSQTLVADVCRQILYTVYVLLCIDTLLRHCSCSSSLSF